MKQVIFYIFILLYFYWLHKEIIHWHLAQIPKVPALEPENIIEIISPGCRRLEEEERGIAQSIHPYSEIIIILDENPLYI